MNKIKIGAISLCLTILSGCSTTVYKQLPPEPLLCPETALCTDKVRLAINNNGDLAHALDRTLGQLEVCALAHAALQSCINQHNENLRKYE
ncbi:Rz1-like lysis system protein LysC [Pasteurella testudinis]|uniref:Rz1-like lysis system protein LysC n=1 Tax=Pasteurella testudinis TaxID=761 RepID=UPI00117D0125|nr:Rz1-like lysis system protein LysC [Pasteurella testudinis]